MQDTIIEAMRKRHALEFSYDGAAPRRQPACLVPRHQASEAGAPRLADRRNEQYSRPTMLGELPSGQDCRPRDPGRNVHYAPPGIQSEAIQGHHSFAVTIRGVVANCLSAAFIERHPLKAAGAPQATTRGFRSTSTRSGYRRSRRHGHRRSRSMSTGLLCGSRSSKFSVNSALLTLSRMTCFSSVRPEASNARRVNHRRSPPMPLPRPRRCCPG